ncbi:hypothetical protein VNO80_23084 [Phaseolus coccineus]|uniref:Uncharacterized protein n=1 Tax=Phaseolus coccineus TaxID=3886 RepID=A0AAN9M633_PHACN
MWYETVGSRLIKQPCDRHIVGPLDPSSWASLAQRVQDASGVRGCQDVEGYVIRVKLEVFRDSGLVKGCEGSFDLDHC